MKRLLPTALSNTSAMAISLAMFVPIYLLIVNSLKSDPDARSMGPGLPTELRFENYGTVIDEGKLGRAFINSLIYTGFGTLLCIGLATGAAFVLSRNRTRLNNWIYLFLVIGIAMPLNYVTLTRVMQATHLINSQFGMVLVYAAYRLPFAVFVIFAFVHTIPVEVDEAAILDGCSPRQLFLRIIVPLLRPAWVTVGVLTFLDLWSEFIMPLYFLSSSDKWPMTLAIYNFFGIYESSWNLVSADVVLTIVPVLLVFIFGQKHIQGGVTAGAVKG